MAVGFFVRLEAREDRAGEVEDFLHGALAAVEEEEGMTTWYAAKAGPSTYVLFNTFVDDEARQAHAASEVAAALGERQEELLVEPPAILEHEVLAQKLPAGSA